MYKVELEEENGLWHDVTGSDGTPLTFATRDDARAALARMYPVLVKLESYGGEKRTRVIEIFDQEGDSE